MKKILVVVLFFISVTSAFAQSKTSSEVSPLLDSIKFELIQINANVLEYRALELAQQKVAKDNLDISAHLEELAILLETSKSSDEYQYYHDFSNLEDDPYAIALRNRFERLATLIIRVNEVNILIKQ